MEKRAKEESKMASVSWLKHMGAAVCYIMMDRDGGYVGWGTCLSLFEYG